MSAPSLSNTPSATKRANAEARSATPTSPKSRQDRLLNTVADITQHRDVDALDHSMVLSLAELTGAGEVALVRDDANDPSAVPSVIRCAQDASGVRLPCTDPRGLGEHESSRVAHCRQEGRSIVERADERCHICTPVRQEGRQFGVLCLSVERDHTAEARLLAEGFARIYANYMALLEDSERDKLTGLYNRRTFDRRLQRQLALHYADGLAADGRGSWLALLDIDHFKRINDTYGHVYGDEVILLLARIMRASFERPHALFRFGGEEFVILIESATETEVQAKLESFRARVASADFPQVGRVTVSLGYARINQHDHPDIVLDRADKALYFAKNHGRNRVYAFENLARQGELKPATTGSIDLF